MPTSHKSSAIENGTCAMQTTFKNENSSPKHVFFDSVSVYVSKTSCQDGYENGQQERCGKASISHLQVRFSCDITERWQLTNKEYRAPEGMKSWG